MARPVDPTRARRGTGNRPMPGKAKVVELAPIPPAPTLPPPPESLPESVHELWRTVIEELAGHNLRGSDLESIEQMCSWAARARDARVIVAQYGLVVTSSTGGYVANPAVAIEEKATRIYQTIASQYGLTLRARLQLGLMTIAGQSALGQMLDELGK